MIPLVKRQPPTGFLRWFLRLPIYVYRGHLGWLLSSRFLLLTHRGRKSGLQRQTVVEVVLQDPASGAYFIASGWGDRADWFRNVQETPDVTVRVGNQRFAATAERLSLDAARQVLITYGQNHPAAFRTLAKILTGEPFQGADEEWRRLAQAVPVLKLRRHSGTVAS